MLGDVNIRNLIANSREPNLASIGQKKNNAGANTSTNYNVNPFKKVPKLHLYKKERKLQTSSAARSTLEVCE